jgi:hypothetical protein
MDNTQFTILVERGVIQINPDTFFEKAPLTNIKKLLKLVFQEYWRNKETIVSLNAYLPQKQAEAKEAWAAASRVYQNGYTDVKFRYELTSKQKQTAEVTNRRLLAEVKRCKTRYERWGKIIAYYETLEAKYDIKGFK